MTRTAQEAGHQMIRTPAMFPVGERAGRQAKLLGRHIPPHPLPRGPMAVVHGMQPCSSLGFAPGLLGGPAAFQRVAGVEIHGLG